MQRSSLDTLFLEAEDNRYLLTFYQICLRNFWKEN